MPVDFVKIKKLIEERDNFLKENPALQVFQDEINRELAKVGTCPIKRSIILQQILLNKWSEVVEVWSLNRD